MRTLWLIRAIQCAAPWRDENRLQHARVQVSPVHPIQSEQPANLYQPSTCPRLRPSADLSQMVRQLPQPSTARTLRTGYVSEEFHAHIMPSSLFSGPERLHKPVHPITSPLLCQKFRFADAKSTPASLKLPFPSSLVTIARNSSNFHQPPEQDRRSQRRVKHGDGCRRAQCSTVMCPSLESGPSRPSRNVVFRKASSIGAFAGFTSRIFHWNENIRASCLCSTAGGFALDPLDLVLIRLMVALAVGESSALARVGDAVSTMLLKHFAFAIAP